MSVRKTDDFIADVERQFEWYVQSARSEVAEGYLIAVEATCALVSTYRTLGHHIRSRHPRLQGWRFIVVFRPFNKHVLFFEVVGGNVLMPASNARASRPPAAPSGAAWKRISGWAGGPARRRAHARIGPTGTDFRGPQGAGDARIPQAGGKARESTAACSPESERITSEIARRPAHDSLRPEAIPARGDGRL